MGPETGTTGQTLTEKHQNRRKNHAPFSPQQKILKSRGFLEVAYSRLTRATKHLSGKVSNPCPAGEARNRAGFRGDGAGLDGVGQSLDVLRAVRVMAYQVSIIRIDAEVP